MKVRNLTFDEFAEQKNKKGTMVYLFLLKDEYSIINTDQFWLSQFCDFVRTVRCDLEEFRVLDIGVHPKTIVFKNGKETEMLNGVPDVQFFQKILRGSKNEF